MRRVGQHTADREWPEQSSYSAEAFSTGGRQEIRQVASGRFMRTTAPSLAPQSSRHPWHDVGAITAMAEVPGVERILTSVLRLLGRAGENSVDDAIEYLVDAPVSLRELLACPDGRRLWTETGNASRYFKYAVIRAAGLRGELWRDRSVVETCLYDADPIKLEAAILAVAEAPRPELVERVRSIAGDDSQPRWIREEARRALSEVGR